MYFQAKRRVNSIAKFKFTFTLLIVLALVSKCATSDDDSGDDSGGGGDYDDQEESIAVSPSVSNSSKSPDQLSSSPASSSSSSGSTTSPSSATVTVSPSMVSYEKEGESLSKLQKFMLEGVENMIKQTLPTLVRSGLETNVSTACANSLLALVTALRDSQIWAFRMLDSSGKLPSGILEGTLTDLGSFEQCLDVKSITSPDELTFQGQYCLLDMRPAFEKNIPLNSNPPPGILESDLVWDRSLQMFWSSNHLLSFRYGACIPSSCSRGDFDQLVNYLTENAGMEADVHSCQTGLPTGIDSLQLVICGIFLLILFMAAVGTSVEYILGVKGSSVSQLKAASLLHFITRFSIHQNTRKLLNSKSNSASSPLRCLDGMRTISISWIILGHTYFFTDIVHYHHYRRIKQLYLVDDNPLLMWLSNFTFSVDTFFHISGILLIYSSWKKLQSTGGKIDLIDFFVHRIWRIWPAYSATIGIALILPLFGSGPLWPLSVGNTANVCRQNWWYNLFFINNFQKPDEICMLHTWFLSASMQFHLLGSVILYVIYRSPRAGIILCSILTIASSISSFIFASVNKIRSPSVIAYEVFAHDHEQKILQLYMMPYNHFGSYLSGVIVGYFLVQHKDKIVPKPIRAILWALSALVAIISLCGPFEAYRANLPSIVESGLYYAFARTTWSWCIGWIIFACATGCGGPVDTFLSWSPFGPLSSLSYLAYLVHPILMLLHTGRIRERIYFGHYELVNIFVSRLVFSFLLAYCVHVLIELPFASIEEYIFPSKRHSKSKAINTAHGVNGDNGRSGMNGVSKNGQGNQLNGTTTGAGGHFNHHQQQMNGSRINCGDICASGKSGKVASCSTNNQTKGTSTIDRCCCCCAVATSNGGHNNGGQQQQLQQPPPNTSSINRSNGQTLVGMNNGRLSYHKSTVTIGPSIEKFTKIDSAA